MKYKRNVLNIINSDSYNIILPKYKQSILDITSNVSLELNLDDFRKLTNYDKSYILRRTIKSNIHLYDQHIEPFQSNLIDIILSIKLPIHITDTKHVVFYFKDESSEHHDILFELDMVPNIEYSFTDPMPLFVMLFTQIWFDGSDELETKFIIITNLALREKIMISQTIGSMKDDWNFLPNSAKYFIQQGRLSFIEDRQLYYDNFIKPNIHYI